MDRPDARVDARDSDKGSGVGDAAGLHEAGVRMMQAGRHLEAQLCCRKALEIDPDHVDTLHLMGLLSLQGKQYDLAIEWTARADQRAPAAGYLLSLATALEQHCLPQEAFKALERAVQLKPDDTEAWAAHGNALANLGQTADAIASYQRVLALDSRHADAAFRSGLLLMTLKRMEEALSCFNLADELHPNHAAVLEQRALALHNLKRYEEALADNLRAHALNPNSAEACNNIGSCLQWLRRDEEALAWFEKALALRPAFIVALINKATSLTQMQRIEAAAAVYRQVQMIDPGNAEAEWNLSLLHLLVGDFPAGWAGREIRWNAHMRSPAYPHFVQPMWLGKESLVGKTILVFADEGIGDTLQFARYVPMLAARGAHVILAVQDAVLPLLSKLPGASRCLPRFTQLPAFDRHCAVCSLPHAFDTRLDTIPARVPYLPAPSAALREAWEQRLAARLQGRSGAQRRPRIGLVWSGNPQHGNDHNRSVPLPVLARLFDVDADFVSLQKHPTPTDKAFLAQTRIVDLAEHLADFEETAALASCLDLVISVDTSVAHLAGGLGLKTWLLLPYLPDYRWLLGRDDSPWYPTMRLFRQDEKRDWEEVVERVRRELMPRRA